MFRQNRLGADIARVSKHLSKHPNQRFLLINHVKKLMWVISVDVKIPLILLIAKNQFQ